MTAVTKRYGPCQHRLHRAAAGRPRSSSTSPTPSSPRASSTSGPADARPAARALLRGNPRAHAAEAADDLRRLITDGLVERGLTYAHATAFATPRRLALARRGPRRAFAPACARSARARAPTPPSRRSRASCAPPASPATSSRSATTRRPTSGSPSSTRPGRPAAEIVAETVEAVVRDFPWPKSMRWGDGSLRWVRPLQSILCILTTEAGAEVVPFEIDGIAAGDVTRGHRFLAPAVLRHLLRRLPRQARSAPTSSSTPPSAPRIPHDAAQLAFAHGLELVDDPACSPRSPASSNGRSC